MKFTKMQACGNDYIYFNCFEDPVDHPEQLSLRLANRHFSVGSDGIILICPSSCADAEMRMFNADGSEGKMCGNAIRCVAKYLYDRNIVKKETLTIETKSGIKTITLTIEDGVMKLAKVNMGKAVLTPQDIPVLLEGDSVIGRPVPFGGLEYHITCVSMGNPHCVVFVPDLERIDLTKTGPLFEDDPIFPDRTNTEFCNVIDDTTIEMRVWERGSGETWACGTGACAAAVASVLNGYCKKGADITVKLRGGTLVVNYSDDAVFMTGPAHFVYEGELL